MIGQHNLIEQFRVLKSADLLPNFMVLLGSKGSGRKTLIREVFDNCIWAEDIKVDTIRHIIELAYSQHNSIFVIADADTMSSAATNALLKVVEECPNNNRFIMTAENLHFQTIKSRACVYNMQVYTVNEIHDYAVRIGIVDKSDLEIVTHTCTVPGEVNMLKKYGIKEIYNYAELVAAHIADVSTSNALKIGNKIAFKNEEDKYDLRLFWKVFNAVLLKQLAAIDTDKSVMKQTSGLIATNSALYQFSGFEVNKQMLFDSWLFNIREAWDAL